MLLCARTCLRSTCGVMWSLMQRHTEWGVGVCVCVCWRMHTRTPKPHNTLRHSLSHSFFLFFFCCWSWCCLGAVVWYTTQTEKPHTSGQSARLTNDCLACAFVYIELKQRKIPLNSLTICKYCTHSISHTSTSQGLQTLYA